MKNRFISIVVICVVFSINTLAQKTKLPEIGKNMKTTPKESDTLIVPKSNRIKTIKSYYVEENINQKFGGYTMTYEVAHLELIDTYDLGPNNTRVITPRYEEIEQIPNNPIEIYKSLLKPTQMMNQPLYKNTIEPINASLIIPHFKENEIPKQYQLKYTIKELLKKYDNEKIDNSKESKKYIYVYLIKTYERIAERGYKSVEIFQKLGDAYFFDKDYTKAVKWYGELFKLTSTVDSGYYDRFEYSLRAIGEKDKANELKIKQNQLSAINKN